MNPRRQRFGMDDDLLVGVTYGDGHIVLSTHHHTFNDRLAPIAEL